MKTAPITIGTLITLLRNCDPDATVRYDFPPYQFPTEIDSYRGSYDEPALGHAGRDSHNQSSVNMHGRKDEAPKVAVVIAELEKAINGAIYYEGWKGGQYRYHGTEPLWVDNRGEYNRVAIVGIQDGDSQVIIRTYYQD